MLDETLIKIKGFIPAPIFGFFQPAYHWSLSFLAALVYGFPSRKINVIAVTGTKGKSSTTEILNAILEKAGNKTALSNTIRFKIGDKSERNLFKMSMPGRFSMQRLIRRAVGENCKYFIAEMTSQGSLLFRHRFIDINTLIFTNLSPEHIEAHGSYKNYVDAKLNIAKNMERSSKRPTTIIVNSDEKESSQFLSYSVNKKISYNHKEAEPYKIKEIGLEFTFDSHPMRSNLSGLFNLYNILAAATCAKNEGTPNNTIAAAIAEFDHIPGRVEKIETGQDFTVVVDYAHTADSLEKLYMVFRPNPRIKSDLQKTVLQKLIAILGGTGGGRDTSKRAVMGKLADDYCDIVILTNEDPYDEDPQKIVTDVSKGVTSKKPLIIMDRRLAIREAVKQARTGDVILITGKGTDPYIMGPRGTKTPWSDADIAREEIRASL